MKLPRSFSLLTFLMLATIVAIAAALYRANNEVAQTRSEFRRYSEEMGFIDVPDEEESQLHVRRLAGYPLLSFGFRYHIPKDKRFMLHVGSGVADPDTGLPPTVFNIPLTSTTEQGTLVVSLEKMPTPFGIRWVVDCVIEECLSRELCQDPDEFTWLQTYLSAFQDNKSIGTARFVHDLECRDAPIGGHSEVLVFGEEDFEFVNLFCQKEFHPSAEPSIPAEMLQQREIFQIWLTQMQEEPPVKR